MRRTLVFAIVFILLFSNIVYGASTDNTRVTTSNLTEQELSNSELEAVDDEDASSISDSIYSPSTNIKVTASYLIKQGISDSQIASLDDDGTNAIPMVVNSIAEKMNLNPKQTQNLVTTYKKKMEEGHDTSNRYIGEYRRVLPNGAVTPRDLSSETRKISSLSQKSNKTVITNDFSGSYEEIYDDDKDGTGAHWYIQSLYGYQNAGGDTDLPSINVTDNDRPYLFFGAYTVTAAA